MKEQISQEGAKIEKFGDIYIDHQPSGTGVLRRYIAYPGYVEMFDFAISNKGILLTVDATICSVIVARKGEMWGLYHGAVDPELTNWTEYPRDSRLLQFLEKIRGINSEGESDFAFLFGARKIVSEVVESRIEAEKALVAIANFKKDRVISRWNDDGRRSSVDVMVNLASSHIYVESVLR